MRTVRAFAVTAALVTLLTTLARAADAPAGEPARERATGRAIERGLTWLAERWEKQPPAPDVAFSHTATQFGGVAVASLSGLAFLAEGAEPDKGRHGKALANCLEYVTKSVGKDGLISAKGGASMYEHGLGMLFLSETALRTDNPDLRASLGATLKRAVALSQQAQNNQGGWRYTPRPLDADVSVTACQLNGLLAARRAGIEVKQVIIDKAVGFVRDCQNPDGGFSYMVHQGPETSAPMRTAAALAVLLQTGGDKEKVQQARKYLEKKLVPDDEAGNNGHVFYGRYYAAQALMLAGGGDRDRLYAAVRDRLVKTQKENGSWEGDFTKEYATAMALIVLQIPDRHLSAFKVGGE